MLETANCPRGSPPTISKVNASPSASLATSVPRADPRGASSAIVPESLATTGASCTGFTVIDTVALGVDTPSLTS